MIKTKHEIIREAAYRWAQIHANNDMYILRTYWFPSSKELRLMEVDELLPAKIQETRLCPLYFNADPENGLPVPMAFVLIAAEHEENLRKGEIKMPKGWGKWEQGERVYVRYLNI
jgi:hypothetical protein